MDPRQIGVLGVLTWIMNKTLSGRAADGAGHVYSYSVFKFFELAWESVFWTPLGDARSCVTYCRLGGSYGPLYASKFSVLIQQFKS